VITNIISAGILVIILLSLWGGVYAQDYTPGTQPQFPFFARHCKWCGVLITGANKHLHGRQCTRRRRWKE